MGRGRRSQVASLPPINLTRLPQQEQTLYLAPAPPATERRSVQSHISAAPPLSGPVNGRCVRKCGSLIERTHSAPSSPKPCDTGPRARRGGSLTARAAQQEISGILQDIKYYTEGTNGSTRRRSKRWNPAVDVGDISKTGRYRLDRNFMQLEAMRQKRWDEEQNKLTMTRTPEAEFENGWHSNLDDSQMSSWEKQKQAGWTYGRYKKELTSPSILQHSLILDRTGSLVLARADRVITQEEKDRVVMMKWEHENTKELEEHFEKIPMLKARLSRHMNYLKMCRERWALRSWIWNNTQWCNQLRLWRSSCECWHSSLCLILQDQVNQIYTAAIRNWMQRVEARVSRTARAKEFTDHFLQAVDEDGDGELSLLELKMSSVRTKSTGGADAMYAKASLWLLAEANSQRATQRPTLPASWFRGKTQCSSIASASNQNLDLQSETRTTNFDKYALSQAGVISQTRVIRYDELVPAMVEFHREHWKFDGVLW